MLTVSSSSSTSAVGSRSHACRMKQPSILPFIMIAGDDIERIESSDEASMDSSSTVSSTRSLLGELEDAQRVLCCKSYHRTRRIKRRAVLEIAGMQPIRSDPQPFAVSAY